MKMMTLMPDDDGTTVFVKISYFSCHRRKCEINNTNISIHHQHQYYHHPHLHHRHLNITAWKGAGCYVVD